jgi:uncharacterized protein HemY
MPWAVYLWPGLPQLADRGSWAALFVALGATMLLVAALVSTFVWTDLIVRELRIICWVLIGLSWSMSAGLSAWWNRRQETRRADPQRERFDQALESYLEGNWIEAERRLGGLLRRDGRDVDARLMLATLLRHTKRFDEATREINYLVRQEGAPKWALEIRREGELLTEARRRASPTDNNEPANSGDS